MKNIYPSYYKKFRCVADKCPDTCCAGWEVVVDPPSERRYRAETASIGDKLRDVLTVDEDGDTVFRSEGGRCPFLLGSGLCELYCELGERALCRTCERFPRFECVLGSRREAGAFALMPRGGETHIRDGGADRIRDRGDRRARRAEFDRPDGIFYPLKSAKNGDRYPLGQENFRSSKGEKFPAAVRRHAGRDKRRQPRTGGGAEE